MLRLFLFLIGAFLLLLGLYLNYVNPPVRSYSQTDLGTQIEYYSGVGNVPLALGLGMLAIAVVWWLVGMPSSTSESKIPDGTVRCPHCGAEVVPIKRPEPLSFRKGEVTYVCPHCGNRI